MLATPPIAIIVAMPEEMTHLAGLLRAPGAVWEETEAQGELTGRGLSNWGDAVREMADE